MNINYAGIIDQAKQRKDALQAFEEATQGINAHVAHLAGMIEWATALDDAFVRLDKEARDMLPKEVLQNLLYWGGRSSLRSIYSRPITGRSVGLSDLFRALNQD